MARLVVETSAWAAYFRGEAHPLLDLGLESSAIAIPAMIYVELAGHSVTGKERAPWDRFLAALPMAPADRDHFERAGKLKREMESRGFSLSARDIHVVQTALDLKAILVTNDPIFLEARKYCDLAVEMG